MERSKPENVVKIDNETYWTIEAKADHRDLETASAEAKDYASKINRSSFAKCRFATGVAGSQDSTYFVETFFLANDDNWKRVKINNIETTGFITPDQARFIIESENANIKDQEIEEELFFKKANVINETLHNGAINKKSRARVIASLLLALANDEYFRISDDPTTLITDINTRVKALLTSYGKENFAQEIEMSLPTSKDNHVKNRKAIVDCIQELKSINIRSAINSGNDLLGKFYEIFLKYANDSKEIGIVLTPRHITRFASEVTAVTNKDYIYDPTCGTGGFLVSALDRVKQLTPSDFNKFRKSHIAGMEQDPEVVGLALVNMIFRGDGNSNIYEGNCFDNIFVKNGNEVEKISSKEFDPNKHERFITRTLMNPPFAIADEEYRFVDHALSQMVEGGVLFAILPTSTMSSTNDGRGEISWRRQLLRRHTLKAVIKLSDDLFLPNAHKGTYGVIIEAHKAHGNKKVFWAIMDDGFSMKKSKRLLNDNIPSNYKLIQQKLQEWITKSEEPESISKVITCTELHLSDPTIDCGPEAYLRGELSKDIDISFVTTSLFESLFHQRREEGFDLEDNGYKTYPIGDFIERIDRGDCPPLNSIAQGSIPVITTTENNNGIEGYYDLANVELFQDRITIPANGSKYRSFYHPYKFAAVSDVLICKLKEEYDIFEFKLYLCAMINQSSWKFSYFRKGTETKVLKDIKIAVPIDVKGNVDIPKIKDITSTSKGYKEVKDLLGQKNKQ